MADEVFGLTRPAVRAVTRVVADHRQSLPATGRRTRRIFPTTGIQVRIGKADEDISKGSSGTISIWTGDAADSLTDSGKDIEAYVRMADVDEGKWVYVTRFPSGWEVTMAEC